MLTKLNRTPEKFALLAVLAGTLAVLSAFLIDLGLSYRDELARGEQELQQFTSMMAEHTARAVEAIDILAREIATDLSLNRPDWPDWSPLKGWEYVAQRHSRAMPQLRDLVIFDANGNQRFISTHFPPPQINVSDRQYFIDLHRGASSSTFGPYIGRNTGRYGYGVAHRLTNSALPDGNRFAGIAYATLEPSYLQDFCWPGRPSDDFDAMLINRKGEIVGSCRPVDMTVHSGILGRQVGEVLFAGTLRGVLPDNGVARARGYLMSTSPVPGFPDLRLTAAISERAVLLPWRERFAQIATLAILLSSILFFGLLLLRRQFNDLRRLTAAIEGHRKKLEERIEQATADLLHEKDLAERANTAKSRFLAAASHDLRQPLHAIALFSTDLLRQLDSATPTHRIAQQINQSAQNLGEMLNTLLDISRLDIGGTQAHPQTFPLQELFASLEKTYARQAEAANLRLRFRKTRIWVHTDPQLLGQILGNLITNALRYTPAGGSVLVGVRQASAAGELRLEVRDNGIGIALADQQHVFAEFFQVANTAREQEGGLGLGLSIVQRLARLLAIEISLRSQVGLGTCFGLRLARAEPVSAAAADLHTDDNANLLHLHGDTAALQQCQTLVERWGYQTRYCDDADCQHLPSGSIVLCLADAIPEVATAVDLIILGDISPCPPGAYCLHLPLRPARLRAVLQTCRDR